MMKLNLREKFNEYMRVLKSAKKPSREELKRVLKITGFGTIIIGFIGFLFYLIFSLLGV